VSETRAADRPQTERYTAALARFATELQFEAIPEAVIQSAKNLVLDGIGCALFGSTLEWPRILTRFVRENEPAGPVTVWGTNVSTSCTSAVMVNGTAVHSFELDDVHPKGGRQHAASVVIAPPLAIAQQYRKVSGRQALTAIVVGVEVGSKIGLSLGNRSGSIGWHAPSVVGVFPAAVASARCLDLDAAIVDQVIGLAATQAGGLHAGHRSGAMAKHWHAGKAAQSGLYAALLASRGFTGPDGVLEREAGGFCSTFTQGNSPVDLSRLTSDLGVVWETHRLHIKLYSCRGDIHSSLDGLKELRRRTNFGAHEVEKITIWGGRNVTSSGWAYDPGSSTRAQHNLGYCLSVMLREGECFIDQFEPSKLADPVTVDLAKRIHIINDPAIDALGSGHQHHIRMEVVLKDGRRFNAEIEQAMGGEEVPISWEDVSKKFRVLAGRVLPTSRIEDLIDQIAEIDRLPDVSVVAYSLAI
jgi:2-methylcitrate dehydratase PrpD